MKIVNGDLIKLAVDGEFDVIIHGCNCFCTMGAGIARSIKAQFPEAFQADLATKKGDRTKLGGFSHAMVTQNGHAVIVINAYTQFHYSGNAVLADYDAITSVFRKLKVQFSGKRFGFPLIGAGLAGGDWQVISKIIDRELQGEDFTLVQYVR
ncbi:macro domain-containing protein [Desulfocicer vacuolatum]|nr:macro domain-containing protein [Desulfocicer vacuolatum]